MIARKPNPAAAPFPLPYARYRAAPEPPPSPLADASPPRMPLVTMSCLASPQGRFGFCLPVQRQFTSPVLRKGILVAPWHGRPPHKLTAAFSGPCGAGKRPAGAAAAMLPAASLPTHVPAAPRKPRTAQENVKSRTTSQAKAPRPVVPRARLAAWHGVKLKPSPSELSEASTTKKIRSEGMMICSRVNRAAMVATTPHPAAALSRRPYDHYLAAPEPPPFPLADASPPRLPLVTVSCLASPHSRFGFCFPVQHSAGVLAAPWHGRPAHKFTPAFSGPCGLGKLLAAAMLAAASVPTQLPAAPRKTQKGQQKAKRRSKNQAKAPRPRKAAVARTRLAAWHGAKVKPSELGDATTIMLRNIPKKIRSEHIMGLLDEHCSRVNRAAGAVIAAYDIVFLPMQFRKEVNFGYALVNFTASAAASGLYHSLKNCCWNEDYGPKRPIKIYRAKLQGKAKLLQHLQMVMRKCENEDFLPVELSPARDGVNVAAAPRRILDQSTQQFFIKPWGEASMSVQLNLAKTTVDNLIGLACKKFRISSMDAYAVLEGKVLEGEAYLSSYPIWRDSTVEIRAVFSSPNFSPTFQDSPSHQIFCLMHGASNVGKRNN